MNNTPVITRPATTSRLSLTTTDPGSVVRRAQLRAAGVSGSAVDARCRPGGPWQRLLPGVLMLGSGPPSREQLLRAALLYVGGDAVITGLDALHWQGAWPLEPSGPVHVLIPAARRVASHGFVLVERTTRMPKPRHHAGLPLSPPARAVLDAARREHDPNKVRTLFVETVRHGACTLPQLRDELDAGSRRGSAQPRQALRSLSDRVHLITECWARRIVANCPIPPPSWLITDRSQSKSTSRVVHAWWQDIGLLWHIGVQGHHGQCTTVRGQRTVLADVVLDSTPLQLHDSPEDVRRDLAAAYLRAASHTFGDSRCRAPAAVATELQETGDG